ncbi:NHS-like protein 3 [Discoglossus pictus]
MSAQTALPPDADPLPPVQGTAEPKKKKHKPGTLRRALSWLRGRKKKKPQDKRHEGKDDAKPDETPQPIPAPEEDPPDNVFFPSGRTPFVEEIHSQAQEGLKSLQRREKQSKLVPDENISEPALDTGDNGFRARSLSCATENTDDALSVRSEMIQRKGSTFRPYDTARSPSGKSGKRRKEKRATVVGVPHHIASELGLPSGSSAHRSIHEIFTRRGGQPAEKVISPTPTVNGGPGAEGEFVVIPTVDGHPTTAHPGGARVSLAELEKTEVTLQRHIDRVYKDDSYINWKSGPKLSPLLMRPKSLAVPGMTTNHSHSDPMSPVMSMSPQATYMSKIIPNAVLPPMVDVVALSRSSVRTLSRCSLTTASPASVRGSLHRGRGRSSSSDTWSRSDSTETIVSDSSTISSQGGSKKHEGTRHNTGLSSGRASPAPSIGTQDESDAASLGSARSSTRSVSLRKSKKAPPPPKRTYSLHQQREMGLPPRPERKPPSKASNAKDPWVPRKDRDTGDSDLLSPTVEGPKLSSPSRSERTLSPSSGYSSQSGTPTLPTRTLLQYPESPGSRRKTPPKPERTSLVRSADAPSINSVSSSDAIIPYLESPPRAGSSLGGPEKQIQIPPHPKVPAPSCPPPSRTGGTAGTPGTTPPPSPPPSHHPTPPPARKSESDAEISHSTSEVTVVRESSWPPPPPEAPEAQDLSMADFPPPDEEEIFLPPPLALQSDDISRTHSNEVQSIDKQKVLSEEQPQLTHHDEKPSNIAATELPLGPVPNGEKPQSAPVLNVEKPQVASVPPALELPTAPVPLTTEPPTVPVLASTTEHLPAPHIPPASELPLSVSTELSSDTVPHVDPPPAALNQTVTNKPLLETTTITTVPPQITVEPTTTTLLETVSTTLVVSTTAPSASEAPAKTNVKSPTPVSPASTTPITSGIPLYTPSAWKPVSASGVGVKKVTSPTPSIPPAPKEDANLPIVTPSLLQMVRLRSVQVRGPQMHTTTHHSSGLPAPQKPVRKSLSLRSPPGPDTFQGEGSTEPSQSPQKLPDPRQSPSAYRSPASTASFVFSRGSRKFVFEPPASLEAEASLKRDLVTELKSHVGPLSPDGKPPLQKKPTKIPPPVARKPSMGHPRTPTSPHTPTGSSSNGGMLPPLSDGTAPSTNGTNVAVTLAGQEQQHQTPAEQA